MARLKKLDQYPPEYSILFFEANRKSIVVACDSANQAENLRNDLYAFRKVLYANPYQEELSMKAQNVRLVISGSTLTAEPIRPKQLGDK